MGKVGKGTRGESMRCFFGNCGFKRVSTVDAVSGNREGGFTMRAVFACWSCVPMRG